ncbi:hypothetical protein ROZALSC1DRAFT_27503 [Rozella allomycis CSF55]|uniref:protein-histidine N-methyltransferase n=1 Tax=Rozella allomycis (strain CSF55) TaxID=988480 RepID=A0A4P9YNG9_ROZAC|nr:hypothetical protein ROZALSC1DRAFT_27503 [Rozella allomycis CSF55]
MPFIKVEKAPLHVEIENITFGEEILLWKRTLSDVEVDIAKNEENFADKGVVQSICDKKDLIPGVYEGGLKVWEASLDLVQYLADLDIATCEGKTCIEIGCGAGLPGIYLSKYRNCIVDFQDFNEQVLKSVTIPNILLNNNIIDTQSLEFRINLDDYEKINNNRFIPGDWDDLSHNEEIKEHYDLLITSETIYDLNKYDSLLRLFHHALAENGILIVAAKRYYFGLGGSTNIFKNYVSKIMNGYKFEILDARIFEAGVPREIILFKKVRHDAK